MRLNNKVAIVTGAASGFGAEIAATVAQELAIPVHRLGGPRIPVGYAPVLEAQARISAQQVCDAALACLQGPRRKAATG